MEIVLMLIIGIFAALIGSIVGLGGGFIIVPILALMYDMPAAHIVGTSMAVLFFTALSSTWAFARQKRIDFKSGVAFSIAMIPGSILGAWTTQFITNKAFFIAFGIFMFITAIFMMFKPNKKAENFLPATVTRTFVDASGQTHTYSFNLWFGVGVSFFVGFASSFFGIGGGSFLVPTMILLLMFPTHIATATSMFTIFLSSIVGAASHAFYDHVVWSKVIWLAVGALIGGQIGAKIASKLPAKIILRVLSISLMIVAVRLMFK